MYSVAHKSPQPFALNMLLGKSINWLSTLCVSWAGGCSVSPCMGAAFCSWLVPSASQLEDHTDQRTLLMVTCRPRAPLFGALTVPIFTGLLQDWQAFQMWSYWHTREKKWCRHQDMKDGSIFEVSPSPYFRDWSSIFLPALLYSELYIYINISQVNSAFSLSAFSWHYKGSYFSTHNFFWKEFHIKAHIITCSVKPKVLLLFSNKVQSRQ